MARVTSRNVLRWPSARSRRGSHMASAIARSRSSSPSHRGARVRSASQSRSFGREDRHRCRRRRDRRDPRGGENPGMDIDAERWLRIEVLAAPSAVLNHPTRGASCRSRHAACASEPRFLEEMVGALADAPSGEAEEILFELAEEDSRFYSNYWWRTTALRFGTPSSARRVVDLTASGALGLSNGTTASGTGRSGA